MIEEIRVTDSTTAHGTTSNDHQVHVQIQYASGTSCPSSIVKPSSLNYKIGLKTAVEEFLKKESKIQDF